MPNPPASKFESSPHFRMKCCVLTRSSMEYHFLSIFGRESRVSSITLLFVTTALRLSHYGTCCTGQLIHPRDARTLAAIKAELAGTGTFLEGWIPPWNCSVAVGLGCARIPPYSSFVRVTYLSMSFLSATPTAFIPQSLGGLPWLLTLDLSHNAFSLSGPIPSSLSSLQRLLTLDLSWNALNGSIPPSLAFLRRLQRLNLNFNELTGSVPSSLGSMSSLSQLDLSVNKLSGSIPSSIGGMQSLQFLSLSNNALTGSIPDSLFSFKGLQSLALSFNSLSGTVPSGVGNLTALSSLDFSINQLSGSIPASLSKMSRLVELILSSNFLSGSIPIELQRMSSLQRLWLDQNNLKGGVPLELGNLGQLQQLQLSSNLLTGHIPAEVSRWQRLQLLDLSRNRLQDSIPEKLFLLQNLKSLAISGNLFSGGIPAGLTRLKQLSRLDLSSNRLNGSIPYVLGNMAQLQDVSLSNNLLSESIPTELARLANLTSLDLSGNLLRGSIPSALSRAEQVQYFRLSMNVLSGSIPRELRGLSIVMLLDLSSNDLRGTIPLELAQLSALQAMMLGSNRLSGGVPTVLTRLSQLGVLDLSSNRLCGKIPWELAGMGWLQELSLGDNLLSGSIPGGIARMTRLSVLNLSRNAFEGSIPANMSTLSMLSQLDLSENQLEGEVPPGVGSLVQLTSLSLGRNNLTGSLPDTLSRVVPLRVLDVSQNHLTGPWPTFFGAALVNLLVLDMGGNQFEGEFSRLSALRSATNLEQLSIGSPNLHGFLPDFLSELSHLTSFSISGSNISGVIPDCFQRLSLLKTLHLASTILSGSLPSGLALLPQLASLQVPDTIPCPQAPCRTSQVALQAAFCSVRCSAFCSQCPPLESSPSVSALLRFQEQSNFPGTWTEGDLGGVVLGGENVVALELYAATATVPVDSSQLNFTQLSPIASTLTSLVLAGNSIQGNLPSGLEVLTKLQVLDLSSNYLNPLDIPNSLHLLSHLTLLDLSFQDTGTTTCNLGELSGLRSLQELSLANANCFGAIPESLSLLSALQVLDLSYNFYQGTVPEGIGRLSRLTFLNLRGQSLPEGSGYATLSLPASLASLPLEYFPLQKGYYSCPEFSGCPNSPVNASSPFCKVYCPEVCRPCYPPPPPPSPPSPPSPPHPPPLPYPLPPAPPPPGETGLTAAARAAIAVGVAVVVAAAGVTAWLIVRSHRKGDDNIERRGLKVLEVRDLERMTGGFHGSLGFEGSFESFKGKWEDPGMGTVVVKRGPIKRQGEGKEEKALLLKEVRILSQVHHRNVLYPRGICLTKDELFLVYEYAAHGALRGMLRSAPGELSAQQRVCIALGAALGLDYLHSQVSPPLVHGNVSSSSVLLMEDLTPKVADFGLSLLANRDEEENLSEQQHKLHGTQSNPLPPRRRRTDRGYLAPESFLEGTQSPSSDVYAFGVVLLELATDLPPVQDSVHLLGRIQAAETSYGSCASLASSCFAAQGTSQGPLGHSRESSNQAEAKPEPGLVWGREVFVSIIRVAFRCCSSEAQSRPSMRQVANTLEDLLKPQDAIQSAPRSHGKGVPFHQSLHY